MPPSVCINCGLVSHTSPIFIKSNVPYLSQCTECNEAIDKLVEYNSAMIFISFLLLRLSVYIHVAYRRIRRIPIYKLIFGALLWVTLTSFGFALAAERLTFAQLTSFEPYHDALVTQIIPVLPFQLTSNTPVDVNDNGIGFSYNNRPETVMEHVLYLRSILIMGLPTLSIPPKFWSLLLLELGTLTLLTIIVPTITHIVHKNRAFIKGKCCAAGVNTPSYLETLGHFTHCLITGLVGRLFLLLSYTFDVDSRVYFAVQVGYSVMPLAISICTYYHVMPGFYTLELDDTDNHTPSSLNQDDIQTPSEQQSQNKKLQPALHNSYRPNLHKTDLFSFWNNPIPIIAVTILYIVPMAFGIKAIYPDIDISLSSLFPSFF